MDQFVNETLSGTMWQLSVRRRSYAYVSKSVKQAAEPRRAGEAARLMGQCRV